MRSHLRLWLCLFTAMTFGLNSVAFAGAATSDPKQVLDLVDQYIAMQAEKPSANADEKSKMLDSTGKAAYLSQAVAVQLLSLEPEDFNLFLFYFMDRYINRPNEREALFAFLQIVRSMIEPDLANTALLQDGPEAQMLEGTYTYGTWILLAGGAFLGWRAILSSPLRSGALVQQFVAKEASLTATGRVLRFGTKMAGNGVLLTGASIGAGVIGGYLEYVLKTHRTHRLDPAQILMVVQSQLACQVSFAALQLDERLDADSKDDKVLQTDGPALAKQIKDLQSQTDLLLKQFPWLTKLTVNDRLFQKTLASYPQATNWQEYRKMLNESAQDQDGQCRQMSLSHVSHELTNMSSDLESLLPTPLPAPVDKKP